MLKIIYKTISIIMWALAILLLTYLSVPSPAFPTPPIDALQSNEPADTESQSRRAYFTNMSREEVLSYYEKHFAIRIFNLELPQYRLNYPPEESSMLIRDQTRSTFLEEIVHPFRESLFINGYEPTEEKDVIYIEEKNWRQKIIIRYVPSNLASRLTVGMLIILIMYLITFEWKSTIKKLFVFIKK